MGSAPDPDDLVDQLEVFLLGEGPTLTGRQIADELGIEMTLARLRWRSLGFTAVGDDVVAFTHADLEAMRMAQRLHEFGVMDPEDEGALVRAMGRSFARLAEWQMGLLGSTIDLEQMDLEEVTEMVAEITPLIESLQSYVWRRHALNAASRMLLAPPADDPGSVPLAVAFADIVGYTRQSRSLDEEELAQLVDGFEARALEIITEHGGRIIKTIGDEIMFVVDDPVEAALAGLELSEQHVLHQDFPELRVGMAWGPALARLGDVYGPVVNVAARLTSTSRPGRVLVDRDLAERLEDDERFKLRRLRRTSVKGYRRLEPWSLRRPADQDPEALEDGQFPGPASQFLHQQTQDFKRVVDELQVRWERGTETAEASGSGER